MPAFHLGRTRVVKVPELELGGFPATRLMPGFDPAVLAAHSDWVEPATYDAGGHALMSIHTWVVWHDGQVILVDTGAGNGKTRPSMKMLDHLDLPFLERLAAVGVRPGDVDAILLTHLHADHVGWNTFQEGRGPWRPTFPNATVICSELEWRYGWALTEGSGPAIRAVLADAGLGDPVRRPAEGVFEDSMVPLEPAGRLQLVKINGAEVLPGVRCVRTPGHSIDHAAIEIESDGAVGIFGGDVMHHPLEIYDPQLVSMFCEFPDAARRSRRLLLNRAADTGALYFSSHFTGSSAGHISRCGEGYAWSFA